MSAWRVSKAHIDALVYWLLKANLISADDKKAVGSILWSENFASVNARYSERETPEDYEYTVPEPITGDQWQAFDPESVSHAYKLVRCYDYQSCEHSGWESSVSCQLMRQLETYCLANGANPDLEGPWGI